MPEVIPVSPHITFISVVFPAPFGPIRPIISPSSVCILISFNTVFFPYVLFTFFKIRFILLAPSLFLDYI